MNNTIQRLVSIINLGRNRIVFKVSSVIYNIDESIFEMQSCEGRCFDGQGVGLMKYSGHLKGLCSCEIDCEDNETCCPDYRAVCLKGKICACVYVCVFYIYPFQKI